MATGSRGRTSNLSWRACRLGICVFRNSRSSSTSLQRLISKEQTLHKSCLTHCGTFITRMDRLSLQFAPEEEITCSSPLDLKTPRGNFTTRPELESKWPTTLQKEFGISLRGSSLTLVTLMSRVLNSCSFPTSLGNSFTPVELTSRFSKRESPSLNAPVSQFPWVVYKYLCSSPLASPDSAVSKSPVGSL
uniref:Uncharacterized protein n=1 Tax=Setaria viridis TaxID=4556 RepID=A0A4V6D3G8_SETVI|nr:hypothetical protein SEVIR_8G252000v2 [Setaria viridis]